MAVASPNPSGILTIASEKDFAKGSGGRNRFGWVEIVAIPALTLAGGAFGLLLHRAPTQTVPPRPTAVSLVHFELGEAAERSSDTGKELKAILRTDVAAIAGPEIAVRAAQSAELKQVLPGLTQEKLDRAGEGQFISEKLSRYCTASFVADTDLIRIEATAEDEKSAAVIANAFAGAIVAEFQAQVFRLNDSRLSDTRAEIAAIAKTLQDLQSRKRQLANSTIEVDNAPQLAIVEREIRQYSSMKLISEARRLSAIEALDQLVKTGRASVAATLEARKTREVATRKGEDDLYRAALVEQLACQKEYDAERGAGKTEQHRDVILAAQRLQRAQDAANARAKQLRDEVDSMMAGEIEVSFATAKANAHRAVSIAEQEVSQCDVKLAALQVKLNELEVQGKKQTAVEHQVLQLDDEIARKTQEYTQLSSVLEDRVVRDGTAKIPLMEVVRAG